MSPYLVVAQMRQRSWVQELAHFLPGAQLLQHLADLLARETPVPSEDSEEILSEGPSDRRRRCWRIFLGAGGNEDAKCQSGGQERPSHERRHRRQARRGEREGKARPEEFNQPAEDAPCLWG